MICWLSKEYFQRKYCVAELLFFIDIYYNSKYEYVVRPCFMCDEKECDDCLSLLDKLLQFSRPELSRNLKESLVNSIKLHPIKIESDLSAEIVSKAIAGKEIIVLFSPSFISFTYSFRQNLNFLFPNFSMIQLFPSLCDKTDWRIVGEKLRSLW